MTFGLNLISTAEATEQARREEIRAAMRRVDLAVSPGRLRTRLGESLVAIGERLLAAGTGPPPRLRSSGTG